MQAMEEVEKDLPKDDEDDLWYLVR
jgi:hypothetical protein